MTPFDLCDRLLAMPALLARAAAAIAPETRGVRAPGSGGFSLVEHAWHLADLEREGYGARIERILAEETPRLPDFDGDRVARERRYRELDLELGVRVFSDARAVNIARLRQLPAAARVRQGVQDGVGVIALGEIPLMMARHDQVHAAELAALLAHLAVAPMVGSALASHAAAALPPTHPVAA